MHHLSSAVCIAALATSLSAQAFRDSFSVPTIPGLPPVLGWEIQTGTWTVTKGGRLITNGASTWSYITVKGRTAFNCVMDVEVFHDSTAGVQFGGFCSRFTSSSSTLMCKIQTNSSANAGFDIVFLYEYPTNGSTISQAVPQVGGKYITSAYIRMIIVNKKYWMQVDGDKDGIYEQTIGPKDLALQTTAKFGLACYTKTQFDNFEFFDAVLKEKTGAIPKIGSTFDMRLFTTATQITPFRAVLSLGNKGFPWGSRFIPLSLDPVLDLSILFGGALGLTGVTDASGKGLIPMKIPNDPALKNAGLYAAAIAIDGTQPMSTLNISNEFYFKIQ